MSHARHAASPEYWSERLDPWDWKHARHDVDRREWLEAADLWLGPHALEALEALGDIAGRRVLELGSGTGLGALHLGRRGASVVGLELSHRRCSVARRAIAATLERLDVRLTAGRAERLPFADASFDAVFSLDVLMYADPQHVVEECERVLRPGGHAVFVEALAGNPLFALYRRCSSPDDYRRFTRHLRLTQLRRLPCSMELVAWRCHYLVSSAAFAGLFVLRSPRLHGALLRALAPLDRVLFRFPGASHLSWRGTAVYRKPGSADAH